MRVSTETSSPLSPPAVPPPPVPVLPGTAPNQTERLPPRQLLRRESSVGYRVPGGTSPSLPPLPSLQEVDCASPSSSEEEGVPGSQGSPATSPHLGHQRRRRPLLRSMSAAFCSLLAPERQVGRAAAALTQDRHTAVGQLVQDLLTQVRAGPEPRELQAIREALSRARAMLSVELSPEKLLPPDRLGETPAWGPLSPEFSFSAFLSLCLSGLAFLSLFFHVHPPCLCIIQATSTHRLSPSHNDSSSFSSLSPPDHALPPRDSHPTPVPLTVACLSPTEHILEKSLHRSVLKPLRPILVARLRRRLSANSSLGRLAEGLRLARARGASAFGSHLSLPSPVEMEQVRQKLLQLLRAYSPSAQVKRLLQACKLLYTALRTQAGMPPPTGRCQVRGHRAEALGMAQQGKQRKKNTYMYVDPPPHFIDGNTVAQKAEHPLPIHCPWLPGRQREGRCLR